MNKVILIGRIANDPLNQSTKSEINYSRFTVAVKRPYAKDQTDYVPIAAWRNQATFIENYLQKGSLVAIEGRFTSSTYTNNEDQKITRYEVTVERIEGLESRAMRETRISAENNLDSVTNDDKHKVMNFAEENLSNQENSDENQEDKSNKQDAETLTDVPWELDDL